MDYTIVSKLALCWERGVWTRAEMHTLDAPLGDSEFRSLNPRMRGNIMVDGLNIRFRLAKSKNRNGRLLAQDS